MKLTEHFGRFLVDEVNLNQTRIDNLEAKVAAVTRFVAESSWGPPVRRFSPQGSWAHGTIIKPPGTKGFDADVIAVVDPVPRWSAADYVENLYQAFRTSGIYRDKVSRKTRCVTLDYAGDFSLDVVPCVLNRTGYLRQEICNRHDDQFEPTDGDGYAEWWQTRCSWAPGTNLKLVTRLLKYLRDIKTTFSVKSVLLTTLIGNQVNGLDRHYGNFSDVPTALKTVIDRLDEYLQARPTMPDVSNPALPSENFTRHWDAEKYANFRTMIGTYRTWIDEAYEEPDRDESIAKWRRVFRDEFAAEMVLAEARSIKGRLLASSAMQPIDDAVNLVKRLGREILERIPIHLPWVEPVRWSMAPSTAVNVRAEVYDKRVGGTRAGSLPSGQTVAKSRELLFEAVNSVGAPFPITDLEVWWRVVNTGEEAAGDVRQLRGGFYKSDAGPGRRWETTKYRGPHWVEAFVVRSRDAVCIGQSRRFFVVIE